MHIMTFSERPYFHVSEDDIIANQNSYFGLANMGDTGFDPAKGHVLYHEYFDERIYAEELGFDGVMLNEHHQTPFCMGSVMDVEAAILARITKKVKIVLLGNPLPVADPLRLAEELAMIDVISGGRLVPGWVRGAGSEQIANNVNPAYNRERFNEAHDFVVKTWTTPGPWRYEGEHYHYRFVNPWILPMQKPHPPIWIPGLVSPETVVWCAQHRYPYIALCTNIEPTIEMCNLYADVAARNGYQAGPENFGYLQPVVVAETGEIDTEAVKRSIDTGYQSSQESGLIITGTPKTVIAKIRSLLEVLRPGIFGAWYHHGPMSYEDRRTGLRLFGEEVLPAMREMAKDLDLPGPYEQTPGIRPLPASGKRDPVVGLSAAPGA